MAESNLVTYYYSPLWIYGFGVSDVSTDKKDLTAYVYHEGHGGKGMNNVLSLTMKYLEDKNIIKAGRTGKKLTLMFDNCGGQNKNNGVIRLCNYLTEMKYFKEVEVVFFIRGHTKNHCDRMFNAMKRTYAKDNVYTYTDLCDAWDSSSNVSVVPVLSEDFYKYDKMMNMFYIKIYDSQLKVNHTFSATLEKPTVLSIRKYRDAEPITQDLKNKYYDDNERAVEMENFVLDPMVAPGLKEIKKKEIINKWGKYLPPHIKPQDVCDMVTDADVEIFKK